MYLFSYFDYMHIITSAYEFLFSNVLVTSILFLFLNIPVAIVFSKAGAKRIDAFIPFKNIGTYLEIVNFKTKLVLSMIVIGFLFCLCFVYLGFGSVNWILKLIWSWCILLLSFPVFILFWVYPLFFFSLLLLLRFSPLCLLLPIVFVVFCCKMAYKFAVKFGLNHWDALIYVIFQPVAIWVLAIWILAFWKYEYQGDDLGNQENNELENKELENKELENKDMKVN